MQLFITQQLCHAKPSTVVISISASLPEVFFPTIVAVNKATGEKTFGIKALSSSVRAESKICYPIKPSSKVDKVRSLKVKM